MATLFSPQESQPSLCMPGNVAFLMLYVCCAQLSTRENNHSWGPLVGNVGVSSAAVCQEGLAAFP